MMKEVRLWDLNGAALIVPMETGVVFSNHVNGFASEERQLEGLLIPINNDCMPQDYLHLLDVQLGFLFSGAEGGVDRVKAKLLDELFAVFPQTEGLKVDRNRLADSVESWVWVVADEVEDSPYTGFGEMKGVLTWLNSVEEELE